MSYYEDRKNFVKELKAVIQAAPSVEIPIVNLKMQLCDKYGFGKAILINELKDHERLGSIKINMDKETIKVL